MRTRDFVARSRSMRFHDAIEDFSQLIVLDGHRPCCWLYPALVIVVNRRIGLDISCSNGHALDFDKSVNALTPNSAYTPYINLKLCDGVLFFIDSIIILLLTGIKFLEPLLNILQSFFYLCPILT